MKISVIGAGNVGATTALFLAEKGFAKEIMVVDIVEGLPQGKMLDMLQAGPVEHYSTITKGSNNYADIEGSDIVIMTAGLPRKPGMDRMDLLLKNKEIVENAAKSIKKYASNAVVIVVTNPLDVMAYAMFKATGFNNKKVVGMAGVLDSTRFRAFIAEELHVAMKDVSALVLGGHGDDMVPVKRFASVSGIPLTELLSDEKINALIDRTRKGGGEIVSLLKTGSAFYAPAASAVLMAEAIAKDEKRLLTAAVYLNGEYGAKDVYCGVPVILGKGGVEKIIEVELSAEEKTALSKSVEAVRSGIKSIYEV
ncbi:MAG: malate dehydrogenase [bacterium]